jgi:CDI immunity proteins
MPGKTLDDLEGVVWGEPTFDSYLVMTCHRLRTKPIGDFSVEDLRIMIGQHIGLPHLIPCALDLLERDALAEGDYYPGDLLASVMGAAEWLQEHPEWLVRLVRVTQRVSAEFDDADKELRERLAEFRAQVQGQTKA